ncbi:BnaAnng37760D [Brassica napus]|uniref:BnaAnng37760D protein n=1 Tax=Brassica napus TaxID=3708 RepID=A0A078K170_BRANA|nr:BnaAnng37760D [Brassica napus]
MKIFGCLCFVMVPGEIRNKLEAKSSKAMFIGYSSSQKGYKCYDPNTRRVLVSREVKFVEEKGYYEKQIQEDLKDLTSDRAETLRIILEGLGISMNQGGRSTTPVPDHQAPNLDHEGGNETRTQNREETSREESSGSHDQAVESNAQQEEAEESQLREEGS